MSKSVLELKQQRTDLTDALDARLESFQKDLDTYTADEIAKDQATQKAIDDLTAEISTAEARDELLKKAVDRQHVINQKGPPEQQLLHDFKLLKAIRSQFKNETLNGAELEAHQEAQKEFKEMNKSMVGQVGIPGFFMATQKDILVGTDTAGGHTVQTDVRKTIPFLRIALKVEGLGATILRNLKGDQKFPRRDNSPASGWLSETGASAEISPTFEAFTMTPHRNATYLEYSTQSVLQSNEDVEMLSRDELSFQVRKSVDVAAIQGSGTGDEPEGVLNATGIGDVAMGVNGSAPTWPKAVEHLSTINTANVDDGSLKWLMTPGVLAAMMTIEKATNTAKFIIEEPGNSLLGAPVIWSNNVPTNLTKGTGTGLHAAILANWPDLFIGQWGGISLLVDPYTKADQGMVRVFVNSYWDFGLRQPSAFVAAQDIVA